MDSIKCVVVGDGAVGKTSSLIAYTTNRFPDGYLPTVFDNFSVKVERGAGLCSLGLYDTASQEDYDRLRLLSYPGADVLLVCFSVVRPDSLLHVKTKWVPEIARLCPGVPFLLVGMQTDLRNEPETLESLSRRNQCPVTARQAGREARKLGATAYLECSALTRDGLKGVFDTAISAAANPVPRVRRLPRVSKLLAILSRRLCRSRQLGR